MGRFVNTCIVIFEHNDEIVLLFQMFWHRPTWKISQPLCDPRRARWILVCKCNIVQKCSWPEMSLRDTVSASPPISPHSIVLGGEGQMHLLSVQMNYAIDFLPFPVVNAFSLPFVLDLRRAEAKFFHEAGFDAYVTGYCFIMTAHLAATVNYL